MYGTAYEDMEIALANGMATQLGEPFGNVPYEPIGSDATGEAEAVKLAIDEWVQNQPDIAPGDPARQGGTLPPGFTWPAAVPIRPGRWDLETSSYRVAVGDTIAGLSATYLGSPARLMEIWRLQPGERRAQSSADVIRPEEWLYMPPDAEATLRAAVGLPPGESGGTAAPPPPGGYATTGPVGASVEEAKAADKRRKYLIAGGIVAGGAALLWAMS